MKTSPAGISTPLLIVAEQAAQARANGVATAAALDSADTRPGTVTVKGGKVLIEAVFADISAEELGAQLDAAGINWRGGKGEEALTITSFVTNAGTVRTFLSGYVDPETVLALPDVPGDAGAFISAAPISFAVSVGSTTSQGDVAQQTDDARASFGIDGTGITVGVLSDSFGAEQNADGVATDTTVADDIATGDLPAGGVLVLRDGTPFSPDGDEGRAMLQIIHDVAPGAALAFYTAGNGQADFANGIIALRNAGADVIVDDIIYFSEPIFQDGVIAQAVDQVVADGAVYLSSAGNNGDDGFFDVYRDSGVDGDTITAIVDGIFNAGFGTFTGLGNLHDWNDDPNVFSPYVELTLPDGADFSLSFQFDEPFASAGGSGSTADYDVYVTSVDEFGNETLAADGIGFANNINSDAVEIVSATNDSGSAQTYRIYITRFDPSDTVVTNFLAGVFFSSAGGFLEEDFTPQIVISNAGDLGDAPQFGAPTLFGHNNAEGALAVGAAAWFNTPEGRTLVGGASALTEARVNGFSSQAGYDVLFDTNGNRLASPSLRDGVDFTSPDGGNTTFFGDDSGIDPDLLPNFFGTSAAAPHAAGLVALMLELNPGLTPADVETILEASADPITLDNSGRTVDSSFVGAGLVDAVVALSNVPTSPFDGSLGDDAILGDEGNNQLRGFAGADTLEGGDGDDTLLGGDDNDTLTGGDGADSLVGGDGDDLLIGDAAEAAASTVAAALSAAVVISEPAEDEAPAANGVALGSLPIPVALAAVGCAEVPNLVIGEFDGPPPVIAPEDCA